MNTAELPNDSARMSPRLKARIAGFFWVLVFVAGVLGLYLRGGIGFDAANIVATLSYAVATVIIYDLLKPVNKSVSLIAALFSLIGCVISLFGLTRFIHIRDLVFFGGHCLLVGYLIFRSTFLPRFLGVLMIFAGLGWLTFASRSLTNYLSPYNLAPGMLGEGLLIVWLLVRGVNVNRWYEQSRAEGMRPV